MRRLICLVLILLPACRGVPHAPLVPLEDPALLASCLRVMEMAYPPGFRLAQRIVIEQGGEQFDCIGALVVRREDAFRAIALGEMGGRLFDFLKRGDDRQVLTKAEGMPLNPLRSGVLRDIEHLFGWSAAEGARAGRTAEGRPALLLPWQEGETEYRFDSAGTRLESSLQAREGRVVRRARYGDYRRFDGWDSELPARILLENLEWGYRLEIELLEMRPGGDLATAFEVSP
ncbi:MAG: hypothetical protein V2A76_07095 [Planctomycetota bacterium]